MCCWLIFPCSYFSYKQWLVEVYSITVFTDATQTPVLCPPCNSICQNEVSPEQSLPHSQHGSRTADQTAFRHCYYIPADSQTKDQSIDHEYCFFSNLLSPQSVNFFLVFIMTSDPHNIFPVLRVLQVTFIIRSLPEVQARPI